MEAACRAIDQGVRFTHYYVWSYLDNWEWLEVRAMGCCSLPGLLGGLGRKSDMSALRGRGLHVNRGCLCLMTATACCVIPLLLSHVGAAHFRGCLPPGVGI